ncbi:MAG TPA: FecR domain-containing protein [Puia sp.]|nr:FecR domain-containing protein [Puia sp.]
MNGDCSPEELDEVMNFLAADNSNRTLLAAMRQEFDDATSVEDGISTEQSQHIRQALVKKIHSPNGNYSGRRRWLFAAAASILLAALTGSYFAWFRSPHSGAEIPIAKTPDRYQNDVQAGSNRAVLTLANGSKIILDDAKDGRLANQGKTTLIKRNGKVAYLAGHNEENQSLHNTITTPRAGQYRVVLPDGSQVWLNAASSITFPTSFTGAGRNVTITGEAYFEVAQNASKPFTVSANGQEIKVLGTHFDVMAYTDEGATHTTLLEGSVRIRHGLDSGMLKPGQQSRVGPDGVLHVLNKVDLDGVMAWKNGLIHFQDADLKTVMRQLARWYDVDVEYHNGNSNRQFVGELPRSLSLCNVLKALEVTGKLKFSIEGRKVIVLPDNN